MAAKHPCGPEWRALGTHRQSCSLDAIKQTHLVHLAETIHQDYANFTENFEALKRKPLGYSLGEVEMVIREQNFAQAAHLDIKLSRLGFPRAVETDPIELITKLNELLPDELTINPDAHQVREMYQLMEAGEIEVLKDLENFSLTRLDSEIIRELTTLEHKRWNQVHALAGYRYNEEKNDSCRLQNCLLDFGDKFPKEKIPYDIEAIRRLPYLVMLTRAFEVASRLGS